MTRLFLGLLKKGPLWTADVDEGILRDQEAHLQLLRQLGSKGQLLLAGPVPGGEQVRGFVLCRADSLAAAETYFQGDRHIQGGRLTLEMHPWLVNTELLTMPLFRDDAAT
jgi:uncharacterized protein YciI